jgi:hypothetical protein
MVVHSVGVVRHPEGPHDHALWRLHAERWLESRVVGGAEEVDERLDSDCLYSQEPAFSASDRAMIDALTVKRNGRLAVVELKADEDIHLDWTIGREWRGTMRGRVPAARVFSRAATINGTATPVSGGAGAACASRDGHPAALPISGNRMDVVGLDGRWRDGIKAVFRKRPRDWRLPIAG